MLDFTIHPSDQLEQLKARVDNYRRGGTYIDRKYQQPRDMLNLLKLSNDEFRQLIIEPFQQVLFSQNFNTLNPPQKTTAVWLFMVVDAYMSHWENEQRVNLDGPMKALALKELSSQFNFILNDYILQMNRFIDRQNHINDKNLAQKLLQINSALTYFRRNQTPSMLAANQYFKSSVLEKVQLRALESRTTSTQSGGESAVNSSIQQVLDPASGFTLGNSGLVDKETGFELDLPLEERISIETDGPHHYYADGPHHPVHHFKALCLRERGWVRVPIDATRIDYDHMRMLASNAANILNLNSVFEYQQKYLELMTAYSQIQSKIEEGANLTSAYDNFGSTQIHMDNALINLLNLEKAIFALIKERTLEQVLVNRGDNSSLSQRQAQALQTMAQTYQKIEQLNNRKASIERSRETFKRNKIKFDQLKDKVKGIHCDMDLSYEIQRLEQKSLLCAPETNSDFENMSKAGYIQKTKVFMVELEKEIEKRLSSEGLVNEIPTLHWYIRGLAEDKSRESELERLDDEIHSLKTNISDKFKEILEQSYNKMDNLITQSQDLLDLVRRSFVECSSEARRLSSEASRSRARERYDDRRNSDRPNPITFSSTRGSLFAQRGRQPDYRYENDYPYDSYRSKRHYGNGTVIRRPGGPIDQRDQSPKRKTPIKVSH